MESPAKEHPAGVWFPDRVDDAKSRRNRLRWYAVGFNGLFLACFEGGRLGTILFTVSTFVLTREHFGRRDRMRPLTAALDSPAAIPHEPVRMEIYRDGVLLGADEGWLGRRNGALAYEGRRTRFEIVMTDLERVPRYETVWDPTRLRLNGERGVVEVDFRPWSADDASRARIQEILTKWPWAVRRLAGPPMLPDPRRPNGFLLTRASGKAVTAALILVFGVLILSSAAHLSSEQMLALQFTAVVLLGTAAFAKVYRRDRQSVALLEASDRESLLPRAQAPTEPSARENVETSIR